MSRPVPKVSGGMSKTALHKNSGKMGVHGGGVVGKNLASGAKKAMRKSALRLRSIAARASTAHRRPS